LREWGKPYNEPTEKIIRNNKFEILDRNKWLPDDDRRIGHGYSEGKECAVYFMRNGNFKLISYDIVDFLTIRPEFVFDDLQAVLFHKLLGKRGWYAYWDKDLVLHADFLRVR